MIRRIDLRAQILSPRELSERLPRAALDAKIQSFAEQHGISYAEAAAQITE